MSLVKHVVIQVLGQVLAKGKDKNGITSAEE